ncbi:MAG: ribonuclease P protein component [Endomicrobium sp.]|nr:ribonuclease P protein component [Endomicrobium sp.]
MDIFLTDINKKSSFAGNSFTYFERLHFKKDFKKVFKSGLKFENNKIKIFVYDRNDGHTTRRLGVVTSKKLGTAVKRNKIKRRLREIFRSIKGSLKPGLDLIFIQKIEVLNYSSLKKSIVDLFDKYGFIAIKIISNK